MTAARNVLRRITAAGGSVEALGEKLKVRAPIPLPDDLMATLRQYKAEVMGMLVGFDLVAGRGSNAGGCPRHEHLDALGLSRAEAELLAWESAITNWSNRHRPTVDPERCGGCGGIIEQSHTGWRPLVDGAIVHYGGMWGLKCWRRHNEGRRIEAAEALERLGLQRPLEWIA